MKIGDKVQSCYCPFWMTIVGVLNGGFFVCRWGAGGGDAGAYSSLELRPYNGGKV